MVEDFEIFPCRSIVTVAYYEAQETTKRFCCTWIMNNMIIHITVVIDVTLCLLTWSSTAVKSFSTALQSESRLIPGDIHFAACASQLWVTWLQEANCW